MTAYNIITPPIIIEGGPCVGVWFQAPPLGPIEWCCHHQRMEQITTAKCIRPLAESTFSIVPITA